MGSGRKWQQKLGPGFLGCRSRPATGRQPVLSEAHGEEHSARTRKVLAYFIMLPGVGVSMLNGFLKLHQVEHKRSKYIVTPISTSSPRPFPEEMATIFYSITFQWIHFWLAVMMNKENMNHYPVLVWTITLHMDQKSVRDLKSSPSLLVSNDDQNTYLPSLCLWQDMA